MKNGILLIGGIVISVLMLVFPAQIFESLFYDTEFSNEMYNSHLYFSNAMIVVVTAWAFAAVFYYVINSVRFSRWYHWGVMLGCTIVVSGLASYFHITSTMEQMQLYFGVPAFHFVLCETLIEAVLFIVASFAMRWWSSNCRHTPFPE